MTNQVISQGDSTSIYDIPGPYYREEDVCKVLKVSIPELQTLQEQGNILYAITSDDVNVYPVFQFQDNSVDSRLTPSIAALKDAPKWSTIIWFALENDDLEGLTPLQWIEQEKDLERVLLSARDTADRWL